MEESELVAFVIIILFPGNSEVVLMQHLAAMIPMDATIGMDQRPWESSHPGIACIRPHKDRTLRIALLEIRWKLVACMQYLDAIIPMDVGPYRWQRPLQ